MQALSQLSYTPIAGVGTVISRDLVTPASTYVLLSGVTASGITCALSGFRLYFCFFKADTTNPSNPVGASAARVWDGTLTGGLPNVESIFQATLTSSQVTLSRTEPTSGSITAGTHYYGLIVTTWNGAELYPAPTNGGTFSPFLATSAGSKNVVITATPATTWPSWVNQLQLIMTTVDNPNRWYLVPQAEGGVQSVSRNGAIAATFTLDFDDNTLQTFTEIIPGSQNDYFSLQQTSLQPHHILEYGPRLVYIHQQLGPDSLSTVSAISISNPGKPQWVTLSSNILNLPGFRQANTGFVIGGVLYICGPDWTYAYSDNTLLPVQWSAPRLVSGSIGSPYVHGVTVNTVHGYAWIAHRSGLYWFAGAAIS